MSRQLPFRSPSYSLACALLVATFWVGHLSAQPDKDSDGDGLSDFHETYKYLTDPKRADSDGDGTPDGDWLERREYQFVIRSVVQVMKPVTLEYINDDFQDARVLDEADDYVELEVIHYPFNKANDAIVADKDWRKTVAAPELQKWCRPGATSDWNAELKKEIETALAKDDIDPAKLDDKQLVEQVSRWLLKRAIYDDGFSTFITAFDEQGRPYIPKPLQNAPDRTKKITVEEQWQREIFASGMFRNRSRGSCTSSAIYLSGCLRAMGIPTRTVLCIPVVDAGDESEMEMVRRIKHAGIRTHLLRGITPLKNSWASHTFNEVYVGGRWRRLNYSRLGQGIYDKNLFGLITHVATFHDWADARMPETVGRRQKQRPKDVFGGNNPYSAISLRDIRGPHCKLAIPESSTETLTISRLWWTDAADLQKDIRENCRDRGRFGLIAEVVGFEDRNDVPSFLKNADLRVHLEPTASTGPDSKPPARLGVGFDPNCYWLYDKKLMIYVPFGGGDRRDLIEGIPYRVRPRNESKDFVWKTAEFLKVTRPK